jgi:NAD(P)-dependent dehydrogenase (short-subunit alcohol dehydrogenase family)
MGRRNEIHPLTVVRSGELARVWSQLVLVLVLGVGPGLGMSVVQRFGAEGYAVARVSRTNTRHADYLRSLAEAAAFTADTADPTPLRATIAAARGRPGRVEAIPGDIIQLDRAGAETALRGRYPP